MQYYIFKHNILFYSIIISLLILTGIFITMNPIHTDEHISYQLEKRIEPTNPDNPYTLVLKWEFPDGSILYDPEETRRYNLEHSIWSGLNWELNNDKTGVLANKNNGIVVYHYSSGEELNEAYNTLYDSSQWKKAIKEAK